MTRNLQAMKKQSKHGKKRGKLSEGRGMSSKAAPPFLYPLMQVIDPQLAEFHLFHFHSRLFDIRLFLRSQAFR